MGDADPCSQLCRPRTHSPRGRIFCTPIFAEGLSYCLTCCPSVFQCSFPALPVSVEFGRFPSYYQWSCWGLGGSARPESWVVFPKLFELTQCRTIPLFVRHFQLSLNIVSNTKKVGRWSSGDGPDQKPSSAKPPPGPTVGIGLDGI